MSQGRTPWTQVKILRVAINNGYVSKKALRLMSENDATRSRSIKILLQEGYLSSCDIEYTSFSDSGKKERQKETAYHINMMQYQKAKERYRDALENVSEIPLRSNITPRSNSNSIRLLRQSEHLMLMQEIGIGIYPGEERSERAYYTKEELMKAIPDEDPQRKRYVRAYGCIATRSDNYILYDLNRNSFVKLEDWLERLAYEAAIKKTKKRCNAKRILLIEREKKIEGVMKRSTVEFSSKGKTRKYMTDTALYKETLLIVKNTEGAKQLDIILNPNIRETLNRYLGIEKMPTHATVDADGIKNDRYVLNFLYPDISKLKRYIEGISDKEELGQIHCYSNYKKHLEQLYPNIEVIGHDTGEVYNYILQENI